MILRQVYGISAWLHQKGFFDLLVVKFLTQFLGFGSILLVAKFLSPVELGEVKIIQSYIAIFSILAGFGFNTAVLKVCSENRLDEEKDGILFLSLIYAGIATILTLLFIVVLALAGIITSSPHLSVWLIVYAFVIPFDVATNIFLVFLQAKKKIKEMARSQAIVKFQSVVLIVLCAWLWGFNGFIFATIVSYVIGMWPFLRLIGLNFLKNRLDKKPAHFMKFALFSVLANGVSQLGQRGDILVLDHFSSNREAIGFYSLALIFLMVANQVTGTVQSIVTPYFSEHALNESWLRRQLILNQGRMTLLSILVAIGTYIMALFVVPLFFGSSYYPTLTYLSVLLISYVVWSSYSVIGPTLLGMGLMHYNFIIVAISTPVGLVLSYLLLKKFGIIGVAWSQVSSNIITLVLVLIGISTAFKRTFGSNRQL